jgi:hypothetical protein
MKNCLALLLPLCMVNAAAGTGLVRGVGMASALHDSNERDARSLQMTGMLTGLVLINARSGARITTLSNNQVIVVNQIPGMTSPAFNIDATFTGSGIQSVVFGYGTTSRVWTENNAPWAFCGNSGSTWSTCSLLGLATHVVTATPFSARDGKGTAGTPLTVTFTIVASVLAPVAPVAAPAAAPMKAPVAAPVTAPMALPPPSNGKWVEVNALAPIDARHEACFVMVGRRAYLVGGRGNKNTNIYNPRDRTWSVGAKPPIELHHMQCVAAQGKLWIMAPWTGGYPQESNPPNAYMYDPATNTWQTKTALPLARRRGSTAVVVSLDERQIYVSHGTIGGHELSNFATARPFLDMYDIATDSWTPLPDAPNPRDHTGGALINGRICVAGGRNGAEINWPDVPQTDCYDITAGKWKVEASIPQARSGSSYGTTCDGKLMIAGGEGSKIYQNVDIFDGVSWTSIANLVVGRHGSGLAVDCACNQIHIASGATAPRGGPETKSVETYFPSGFDTPCTA